jgi:hypothetical protein
MNTATPKRTHQAAYLASCTLLGIENINDWRDEPKEVNAMLSICELMTSLPPVWFTQEERIATVMLIKELYGDPKKFLDDLMDGSVSFIAKTMPGRTAEDMMMSALAEHALQFGKLDIQ